MNLQAILVANITGFLIILFLFISRFITRTKSDTEEHVFQTMMCLAMFGCLIEPLTFAVDGVHSVLGYWINFLGNTYLYYANGLGSFFWLMYVDLKLFHNKDRMKRIYYKLAIPVSALLISLIGNVFFKYYFYVDENFVYHRKDTLYIFYIYMICCALYSICLYYYAKRRNGGVAFFPIYMYLVPIIIGSVLQMVFYGISTAWLGTALGIVALNMSLQQQYTFLDQLTGLYNRDYLAHTLFKINKKTHENWYGIMIDMNDFKSINDNYGHAYGDQALRDMAHIIAINDEANATAFRFAGDEFIILMKTDNESNVYALEYKLKKAIEEFNKKSDRPYELSFSIGHSKYETNMDTSSSFFKKIDAAMYEDKRLFHNKYLKESKAE